MRRGFAHTPPTLLNFTFGPCHAIAFGRPGQRGSMRVYNRGCPAEVIVLRLKAVTFCGFRALFTSKKLFFSRNRWLPSSDLIVYPEGAWERFLPYPSVSSRSS